MDTRGETMLEDAELDAMQARVDAATPGPWVLGDPYADEYTNGREVPIWLADGALCASPDDGAAGQHRPADADLIAHAREDIARLVAEVRRLHREPS